MSRIHPELSDPEPPNGTVDDDCLLKHDPDGEQDEDEEDENEDDDPQHNNEDEESDGYSERPVVTLSRSANAEERRLCW
jgi:hypothetical protein